MISKSRVYDYIALSNGYNNHFDRLPNDLIEKILQNMYPIEVYDSKIYYKCKKYMLEQLINIKIKLNRDYDSIPIKLKIKYYKKYDNQYYFKPEIKKLLRLPDMKVKKSCIDKIMIKQNKLLLNRICLYRDDCYLMKCICSSYCTNPLNRWNYRQYNTISYYPYRCKHNHNSRLCKKIEDENKCLKYGDNILYCNTCDKYMKKSSIKNHTKGKEHKYKTNKYNYNLVLEELKKLNE